jgi:toxin-antitoxin system PIN domain toxin
VTLVDANVLIYAWIESLPQHRKAREWIESQFSESEWIGIPWVTVWAFLRLSTSQRVFPNPLGAEAAFKIVQRWIALPNVAIVQPGPRHAELLRSLALGGHASGPLITDAVMAALTIEQGASLATTDQDFSRFPGLNWFNPLAGRA